MNRGRRLSLLVLLLVEVGVVVAALGWLRTYFHPPAAGSSSGAAMFSLRYPGVSMPFEIAQVALSCLVGYAAVAGLAGKEKSIGLLTKLLPVAAIAAVVLAALDTNAQYSFHGAFAAMTSRTHGAFGSSLAEVNDTALRNGLIGTLTWTVGRLATYGVIYAYVGRRPLPREAAAEA